MVTVSADNGRDAIRTLQDDPAIDIVLMDIMMPEMDGMETMREIRKIPRLKSLPIVAVTAQSNHDPIFEAGCSAVVEKPFQIEDLVLAVRGALARAAAGSDSSRRPWCNTAGADPGHRPTSRP